MSLANSIRWECSYLFCKHDCGLLRLFLPFYEHSFGINIVVKQGSLVLLGAHLFYRHKAVSRWALL